MNKFLVLFFLSSVLPLAVMADAAKTNPEKKNPAVTVPNLAFSGDLAFELAGISNETPQGGKDDIHNIRVGLGKMFLNGAAAGQSSSGLIYSANTRIFLDGNRTKIAAAGPSTNPGKDVAITDAPVIVDRAWVEVKGIGLGTLQIGQYIGALDAMIEDASYIMGGNGAMMNGNWSFYFNRPTGTIVNYRQTGDTRASNKITYYTPRIVGLQAGVSFTPRSDAYGLAKYQDAPLTLDTAAQNTVSGGVNYAKSFSGFDVKVAATGASGTTLDKAGNTTLNQDILSWEVSARVSSGPFDIAGGYLNNGNSSLLKNTLTGVNTKETAGEIYDIAVRYTIGAAKIALGTMYTTKTMQDGKLATLNAYSLTADYNIEKGLVAYVDLTAVNATNNGSTDSGVDTKLPENKGFVGFVGLNVSF